MAGRFPYEKYDARDFVRVPGSARNYRNIMTGTIISRRQYKQHYAPSIKSIEPLLHPARGRKSARKLAPAEKEVELNKRKVKQQEKAAAKKIARLKKHKPKPSIDFSLRGFKKGYQSKVFEVEPDVKSLNKIRLKALASRNCIAYIVGINLVDEDTGNERTYSLFAARYIYDPVTEADIQHGHDVQQNLHLSQKSGNVVTVSWWMRVFLNRTAGKRNGVKYPNESLLKRK